MHVAPSGAGLPVSADALSGAGLQVSADASLGAASRTLTDALSGAGKQASADAFSAALNQIWSDASLAAGHWPADVAQPACCSADFAAEQGSDIFFYPEQLLQRKESRSEKQLKQKLQLFFSLGIFVSLLFSSAHLYKAADNLPFPERKIFHLY